MPTQPDSHVIPLQELYSPIAADLDLALEVFRQELASDQVFIDELCAQVARYHGKMLRPVLLLLSGQASGGIRDEHHVLAAVVEMVHIATLVHDDILDESEVRRRVPTVNHLWGNERAVLLGDFLISHAFHLCSSLDSQMASRRIGRTTNEVCEGEMMQVANRDNLDLSETLYLEIIKRKTASLIGTCCELGAWAAGADAATVEQLRGYGVSLGIAFQIVDDMLDLTGKESTVGKSVGRDVQKGKLTLPLIHYLRNATPADAERMRHRLVDPANHGSATLVPDLRAAGSLEYARNVASEHVQAARFALATLPASEARNVLGIMADYVIERNR